MGTRNKPLSPADKAIISLENAARKICLLKREVEFTDEQMKLIEEHLLRIMKAVGIEEVGNIKKKQKRQTPPCAFF